MSSRHKIEFNGKTYTNLFHDKFRPLTEDEDERLDRSIKRLGVLDAPLVDEDDNVIDGWNRLSKAVKYNQADTKLRVLKGLSDEEKLEVATSKNVDRRQFTAAELKKYRDERLKKVALARVEGLSIRAVCEKFNLSVGQVTRDLEEARKRGFKTEPPETVTGRDGKPQKSTKPEEGEDEGVPPGTPGGKAKRSGKRKKKRGPRAQGADGVMVKDPHGTPIPEGPLRDVFADVWHESALETLGRLRKEAKGVLKWSAWLDPSIITDLATIEDKVKTAVPDRVCDSCNAEKDKQKTCTRCRTSGYVGRGVPK